MTKQPTSEDEKNENPHMLGGGVAAQEKKIVFGDKSPTKNEEGCLKKTWPRAGAVCKNLPNKVITAVRVQKW